MISARTHAGATERFAGWQLADFSGPTTLAATIGLYASLIASGAHAETVKQWGHHPAATSTAEIHEPTDPAAFATITFRNEEVHGRDEAFVLTWEGVEVTLMLDWQADGTQAERLMVYPPEGFIAVPPEIVVGEGSSDEVQIYEWAGM